MTKRTGFNIPSLADMDQVSEGDIPTKSLFNKHKMAKVNSDIPASGGPPPVATSSGKSSGSTSTLEATPGPSFGLQATSTSLVPRGNTGISNPTDMASTPSETSQKAVAGLPVASSNALIVSTRQRGNPLLKHVRNVIWEFGDIIADYQVSPTGCALFLSLRYHALNPNYIHERLKQLGHSYELRVLLVQVDVKDPHHSLKELAKICILSDCTLLLVWSAEEAARYLETFKSYENKPPDLIMEKTDSNFLGRVADTLTSVKKVNKTDATTLLSTFGTLKTIVEAGEEDLSLCPGFGPQKAKRLHDVFHEPFLKAQRTVVPK